MINLLRTIASPEKQTAYQKNVPIANVANEIVCQWFDDFHPNSELFRQAFLEEEIKLLEQFTRVFDKQVDKLPDNLEALLASAEWEFIMSKARVTLEAAGWKEN